MVAFGGSNIASGCLVPNDTNQSWKITRPAGAPNVQSVRSGEDLLPFPNADAVPACSFSTPHSQPSSQAGCYHRPSDRALNVLLALPTRSRLQQPLS